MSDRRIPIVPFDGEHLAERISLASLRLAGGAVDRREVEHLVGVVTRCSAFLENVYTDNRLRAILLDDPKRIASLLASPWFRLPWGDDPFSVMTRLRSLPDKVREVGDQALFDVSISGRTRVRGVPLEDLGRKAYCLAADVLEQMADDARLRELFLANAFGSALSFEQEVAFLRRCAERFDIYSRLLREAEEETDSSPAAVAPIPAPNDSPAPLPVRATAPRLFRGETSDRERLLSAYERLLLFAALDLDRLSQDLGNSVVDQEQAIATLIDDFALFAVGTQSLTKPASYFLVGPTGVGKNHMVETLQRHLSRQWQVEIPMLTIEGPNYTYPSDINELRGATRGFIRSDEPGLLTEFHERAQKAPLSIILVDEVEKAHPQLRRFFLSILDRGTTTDAHGNELHLEGALIFFTSNIGYHEGQSATASIGFGGETEAARVYESELSRSLKRELSPEFINRVKLVRFHHLPRNSAARILHLEFERVAQRYREVHGLELLLSAAAEEWLLDRGYSHEYGARHLALEVQRWCNVEVGKRLRRDERGAARGASSLLDEVRRAKDGEATLNVDDLDRRVLEQTRARVDYAALMIDVENDRIVYRRTGSG